MKGEITFDELVGVPEPGNIDKYKEDLKTSSFLQNILQRRISHSLGLATKKTTESPFISLSPLSSGTFRFAEGGYVRAYLVSKERLNAAVIHFKSENEVLAPLFLLPDEEVIRVSRPSDLRLETAEENLLENGKLPRENRFFESHHAQSPLDWLKTSNRGNITTNPCSLRAIVSGKIVF